MEGRLQQPPAPLIPRFWFPGWNSDQSVSKFQIEVGGPLRGGDPGVRVVEPPAEASDAYFPASPPAEKPESGILLVVARHHVFGSDELSALSRGIASRTPVPYIAVSAQDAKALGLVEGQEAFVVIRNGQGTQSVTLITVVRELPPGVASVPYGVLGMPLRELPALVRVTRAAGGVS
jgi:NADH-quinone oxidoreductase subunit G